MASNLSFSKKERLFVLAISKRERKKGKKKSMLGAALTQSFSLSKHFNYEKCIKGKSFEMSGINFIGPDLNETFIQNNAYLMMISTTCKNA